MAHMRKLLALAAATGAASAACPKEGTSDGIKADDKTKPTSTSSPTTVATPTVTSTPSDTATVVAPPTTPSPGYMVVDMLPPPAKCAGAAATITPTAAWKTSASGAMGIEVHLRKSTRPDVIYSSKSTPSGYGGTIVSTSLTGSEVVITLVPDAGATYAGLYVPLECKAGDERLNVELDLSAVTPGASPKSGTPVKVNIYDSY
jgi:hypothetical protein